MRAEWLDHLIPLQLLRVLWDALFPSRFERVVLEGVDGSPEAGYARPITFSLGCWLLLFAVGQAFPWAFTTSGMSRIFTILPAAERRAVAAQLGVAALPGGVIPDTGDVSLGRVSKAVNGQVRQKIGKRVGRVSIADVASYVEAHGDSALGLRVRGYGARVDEKPKPFDESTFVLFVVFGLVPGWYASHLVLRSAQRTAAETRHVHMYNDGWFVVSCLVPFSIATYAGEAVTSKWPQRVLAFVVAIALVSWIVRTIRLFRVTHGSPAWRVAGAHVIGIAVAVLMCAAFDLALIAARDVVQRMGFG